MSSTIIKYLPFQSKVDPTFWMKLGEHKLNILRLDQEPIDIEGTFTLHSTIVHRAADNVDKADESTCIPGSMRFDQDSISIGTDTDTPTRGNEHVITNGKIHILNTLESFKSTDKNELLNKYCLGNLLRACGLDLSSEDEKNDDGSGEKNIDSFNNGVDTSIQALTSFYCLCHLDLKTHKVLYWFAFPVLTPSPGKTIKYAKTSSSSMLPPQCTLKYAWSQDKIMQLEIGVNNLRAECTDKCFPPYFIVVPNEDGDNIECFELSFQIYNNLADQEKTRCSFAFLDVTSTTSITNDYNENISNSKEPIPVGWTLRNLIAYVTLKLGLSGVISVISYRPSVIRRLDEKSKIVDSACDAENNTSLLLQVQLPSKDDYIWPSKQESKSITPYTCVGWELNARNKPGPRSVNLAPLLSPSHLAQQATDLNLKLMKWRMIPNLNLDNLSNLRVLLLGAGTLGCSVARTLLGWGVRNFVFVDNGKVSYSNPVRQNLFDLVDCEGGGKDKAIAAADALKRIAGPSINSDGLNLTIPMPGHAFTEKEIEGVKNDVTMLQKLIDNADVVFLLTDTRESRWLPTVMARASDKMMINAALGLDSWLVMRHGGNISEGRLGCYFCNDVVAPENSTKNRTLDQQCTVTRPGLAPIASSLAVELMVSLLHHDSKQNAPAPPAAASSSSFSPTVTSDKVETSPLGLMPHQIRGSIVTYTMMTPTVPAFQHCTGCCDAIKSAYIDGSFEFVRKVCCEDGSYLEDIAGLTKFRADAASMMGNCIDWDEADGEGEDDF